MKLYLLHLAWTARPPTLRATLALSGATWLSQSLLFEGLLVNQGVPAATFIYLTALLFPSLLLVNRRFAPFCAAAARFAVG
jgi:lipopolysaccharide export LptBFGC system permease protein LptF